jgi:anti-sigma regulatory factor (Ser/Thr protein kinase)
MSVAGEATGHEAASYSSGTVALTFPLDADLLVLARLTAATMASRAGFDVEEIDDLRLAVDELCLSLVRGRGDGELHLDFDVGDGTIEIRCRYRPSGSAAVVRALDTLATVPEDLSTRILDVLVDAHGSAVDDGVEWTWLRKRRGRPSTS